MILPLGYLDSVEIQVMISLLKIIDNPINDIALVTVLRSMIGGFTDNELIEIKLKDNSKSFYEAMCEYKNKEEADEELKNKIEVFLNKIENFRKEQEYMPLDEFIWKIYLDTGYYSYVSLMPNGILRVSNLKLLFEKAKQYEKTSFKGLYNFISFIDKLKLSSNDMSGAKLIGENEDVIRIMSIHKSKGLEFPVVFLCGTSKKFNMQDIYQSQVLLHQDLGIGPKYINYEEGETYTTPAREAIKIKLKMETIAEEMRVLYVALTRAKEKLIITGIDKDYKKSIDEKEKLLDSYKENTNKINKSLVQKYISYLDWLELVSLKRKKDLEEILDTKVYSKKEVLKSTSSKEEKRVQSIEEELADINEEELNTVKEKLEWKYPYNNLNNILTKSSVTKIKSMKLDLEEEYEAKYNTPEFLQEEKESKLSSAEKGTLMHLILQKLDVNVNYDKDKVQALIQGLEEKGRINGVQAKAVDIDKILKFTESRIWKEMQDAKEIQREKPFYLNVPAKEIYEENIDENILVQGVIDLYYITKDDELVLVDYKTDKVNTEAELIEKYKEQLKLYKEALEKALDKKACFVYIYSLYLGKVIEINI